MAIRGKSPRAQVPLRIPEAGRARLEKAAKARGISMNAECVERLDSSFQFEDRLGGPRLVELIETIASVMRTTGEVAASFTNDPNTDDQGKWLAVPYAFDQAVKAANTILEYHRPKGPIVEPKLPPYIEVAVVGKSFDPEESAAQLRDYVRNVGNGMAAGKLLMRRQDDE